MAPAASSVRPSSTSSPMPAASPPNTSVAAPRTLLWGWPASTTPSTSRPGSATMSAAPASPGTSDATACTCSPRASRQSAPRWLRPRSTRAARPPTTSTSSGGCRRWRSPRAPRLHTGSIATVLQPGAQSVTAALRGPRGRARSYDPNIQTTIMGDLDDVRTRVEELVGLSDVVKASDRPRPALPRPVARRPGPLGGVSGHGPGHPGGRGSDLSRRLGRADRHRAGPGRPGRRHRRRRQLVHRRAGVRAGRRRTAGRPGGTRAPAGSETGGRQAGRRPRSGWRPSPSGRASQACTSVDELSSPQPWSPRRPGAGAPCRRSSQNPVPLRGPAADRSGPDRVPAGAHPRMSTRSRAPAGAPSCRWRPRRCACSPTPPCTTSPTTCARHLAQLRRILDDPEASNNDKFVALDLLKNANIAAGGILPMCQDTGTAIVMGKRGQHVLTEGTDQRPPPEAITTPSPASTCATGRWPRSRRGGRDTGSNLPAQIEDLRRHPPGHEDSSTSSCSWPRVAAVPTSSYLYQETKAILNPERMLAFLDEKLRSLGTAACPPYHLAIVIGGTSAEFALKTAKYASAEVPRRAAARGRDDGPRVPRHQAEGAGPGS